MLGSMKLSLTAVAIADGYSKDTEPETADRAPALSKFLHVVLTNGGFPKSTDRKRHPVPVSATDKVLWRQI